MTEKQRKLLAILLDSGFLSWAEIVFGIDGPHCVGIGIDGPNGLGSLFGIGGPNCVGIGIGGPNGLGIGIHRAAEMEANIALQL